MVIIAYIYILCGNNLGYACRGRLLDMGSSVEIGPDQESIIHPNVNPMAEPRVVEKVRAIGPLII